MLKKALTPRWLLGLLLVLALASGFVALSKWQLSASTLSQIGVDPSKNTVRPYQEILQPHTPLTLTTVDSVVEATGTYAPGSSYLVQNKLNDGEHGYWVITLLIPDDGQTVETSQGQERRGIAVARAWVATPQIPAEPTGTITVAGRIVGNDPPLDTTFITEENRSHDRMLAAASAAYLTNVWDAPLYNGILTADSESASATPLDENGAIAADASIIGQDQTVRSIRADQVTNDSIDWLNIFYAVEWLVFAAFALYLWWRMLKDSIDKEDNPGHYFEYEGEYWVDEETGRPYYWDPADQTYYYFDQAPEAAQTLKEKQ